MKKLVLVFVLVGIFVISSLVFGYGTRECKSCVSPKIVRALSAYSLSEVDFDVLAGDTIFIVYLNDTRTTTVPDIKLVFAHKTRKLLFFTRLEPSKASDTLRDVISGYCLGGVIPEYVKENDSIHFVMVMTLWDTTGRDPSDVGLFYDMFSGELAAITYKTIQGKFFEFDVEKGIVKEEYDSVESIPDSKKE